MNKLEALTLLYFRLTRKLRESTPYGADKDRQTNQHNRKSSERTTHTYTVMTFSTKAPKQFNGERKALTWNDQIYRKKKNQKRNHCHTPYTNVSLRWTLDLSVKANRMKLLVENIKEHLHDLGQAQVSGVTASKNKKKVKNQASSKLKVSFCSSENTIKKMDRQATNWEKYSQNLYLTMDWYPG